MGDRDHAAITNVLTPGSGQTTVTKHLMRRLEASWTFTSHVSLDNYSLLWSQFPICEVESAGPSFPELRVQGVDKGDSWLPATPSALCEAAEEVCVLCRVSAMPAAFKFSSNPSRP
jgi:hypothetical protein